MKISKFQVCKIKIKTTEFCLRPYFEVQLLSLQHKNNRKTNTTFVHVKTTVRVHKLTNFNCFTINFFCGKDGRVLIFILRTWNFEIFM
jgi:hypothetical protein